MPAKMSYLSIVPWCSRRSVPPLQQLRTGGRRALHTSSKTFANDGKTFRAQLYESTARRIQAQREAEARFASMVPTSAFASNSAFTFGMRASAAETSKADFCSSGLLVRAGLLVRKYEARKSIGIIHYTSIIYGSEWTEA